MRAVTNIFCLLIIISFTTVAFAGDDPTIPVAEKLKIKTAMKNYIFSNSTVNGNYLIQDEKIKKVRTLKFGHVHKGVVKHNDGFLACVDLLDGKSVLDLDFIVNIEGGEYKVSKIAIHKVDGIKRKDHLEM